MIEVKEKEKDKDKKDEPSLDREIQESFIKNRKLFLWNQVDDEAAEKLVKQFIYLDSINNEDIYFFINSPGGVISSGLAVYDCMQAIKSDVCTVVAGQAASMGAILLTAGAPGKRYSWPSSRIMIHQPLISGQIYGPASDIEIQAEEMLRMRNYLNEILSKHTGKSLKQIEADTDRDNYMNAKDAIKYNLIDTVESKI